MNNTIGIELGNVVPGAAPLGKNGGVNETFIGHIDCANQRFKAYIKVLNDKQLVNELLVNILGRRLGLPIPKGFLLRAKPSDLPGSIALNNLNQEALVFGSQALKHPSLARRYKNNNAEVIKWLKANCKILDDTIIFDDFVANTDRHSGNLLVDGKETWLIDHGHCFTGPQWVPADLVSNQIYTNVMADTFVNSMTLPQRHSLRGKATQFAQTVGSIDKKEVLNTCYLSRIIPATELNALELFVTERVTHITNIISSRVGIPNLGNAP